VNKMEKENIIRTILKNEITWLIMLVGAISSFFSFVVIPINHLNYQVAQIQIDILSIKSSVAQVSNNTTAIAILQEQVKRLEK